MRNLESHTGTTLAYVAGIVVPFASGWLFYFGTSFSDLVSIASPLLNGVVQFIVPGALFWAYSRLDSKHPGELQMLGLTLKTWVWVASAIAMVFGTVLFVGLTYSLSYDSASTGVQAAVADDYATAETVAAVSGADYSAQVEAYTTSDSGVGVTGTTSDSSAYNTSTLQHALFGINGTAFNSSTAAVLQTV